MELKLETVFNNPGEALDFCYRLPERYDALPFAEPPLIQGRAANRAGVVTLSGTVRVQLNATCDRCAEPFCYQANVAFAHTLVTSRESEESDELVLVKGYRFAPDDLIWEDIVLAMPPKLLCSPDCRGLCPRCGSNLNGGSCGCLPEGDPRLAALRQSLTNSGI